MDFKDIEELAGILNEYPVTEILVESKGKKVHLRKGAVIKTAPLATNEAPFTKDDSLTEGMSASGHDDDIDPTCLLTSKFVGIFHHAKPTVRVGTVIKTGQTVGNVESMKVLNEVVADMGGQVVEVLVEEGAPIDYGAELFRILPS